MGSNYINRGEAISVSYTAASTDLAPATFSVGDPIVLSSMPAVGLTDRTATSTQTTLWTYGKYRLSVDATSATFAPGDIIYFQPTATNDTHLTNNSSASGAIRWGYALESSGSSGSAYTVEVLLGY